MPAGQQRVRPGQPGGSEHEHTGDTADLVKLCLCVFNASAIQQGLVDKTLKAVHAGHLTLHGVACLAACELQLGQASLEPAFRSL